LKAFSLGLTNWSLSAANARLNRVVVVVLVCLCLTACAGMARLDGKPSDGQRVEYQHGRSYLVSIGEHSLVVVVPYFAQYRVSRRLLFVLRAENYSAATIDFSEADIFAAADGEPIAVIPAARLEQEVGDAATSAILFSTLTGLATQTNSPVAQELRWQRAEKQLENIREAEQASLQSIRTSALQRTTLHPGDTVQGYFVVDVWRGWRVNAIELVVIVGADRHSLTFTETQL
jgi:hypothetical protein